MGFRSIVKQDDPGDKFYIIEEGECQAFKTVGEEQRLVLEYKPGDYFGELALLRNEPRAATVMATSSVVKVLALDRRCFKRLEQFCSSVFKRQIWSLGVTILWLRIPTTKAWESFEPNLI